MSSPTQRSLAKLRKDGWPLVEKTEHWVSFGGKGGVLRDLFGFCDCLAIRGNISLAVQTTSGDHVAHRLEKMQTLPSVVHWLSSPNRKIVIHGWAVRGKAGKRKLWTCREVEVVLNETNKPIIREP